jgi:hypothetical protein
MMPKINFLVNGREGNLEVEIQIKKEPFFP